jgi:hypothetical protein
MNKFLNTLKRLSTTDNLDIRKANKIIENSGYVYPVRRNIFLQLVDDNYKTVPDNYIEQCLIFTEIIFRKLYQNLTTLDSVMAKKVRNVLCERYGKNSKYHKMSKTIVKITYEEKGSIIDSYKKSVIQKRNNLILVEHSTILDVFNECIDSDNIFKRLVSLLIASGCRPYYHVPILHNL